MRPKHVQTDIVPASRRRHGRPAAASGHRADRRRPGMLLGALLAGGLAAGLFGFHGTPDASAATSVAAAQKALLAEGDDGAETIPQAAITEVEARARLEQVTASRAARQAAATAPAAPPAPECVLPAHARLTSTFAMRWGVMHAGIDLAAPMRTPEYAAKDGVVLRAGTATGFGLAIWLLHANGDVTVYGHMDSLSVKPGQYVQAGQTIALMGARGEATGPHLHFEVHRGSEYGNKIDPLPWLRACGVSV